MLSASAGYAKDVVTLYIKKTPYVPFALRYMLRDGIFDRVYVGVMYLFTLCVQSRCGLV